jgi:SPP1 gp7 family putative phage head morphogenesis protein
MLTTAVPFEEAAAFLQGKPAVSRAIFDELLPELRARAFVITGVDRMDAVQAARDAIAEIPRGADWAQTKKALTAQLAPWLGEGAELRTEMLMRWHGYQAYAVANKRNLDANTDLFPYRQYQTAQDGRVRDTHAALNGLVLPAESKFWDRHTPPWEYGCRCDVRGVTAEEADEIRAEDARKPEEKRRVLEGPTKEKLEQFGRLEKGINEIYDVRTPSERGESGVEWGSKDLVIPIEALRERYDVDLWARWRDWAEATVIDGYGSIWQWLNAEWGGGPKDELF